MKPAPGARQPFSFPGFDGLRLLAAWAVVYSHSYPIASGPATPDPLISRLGDVNGFGDYAVQVFFILSGFLLAASLDASFDPLRYLASRLFRIVPGFCFATVVSVLCLAPLLTGLGFVAMFMSPEAWSSILWSINGLGDLVSFTMPLVRYPDLSGFLNGSLWSIPYELAYYLVLLALYLVLRRDSWVALGALALTVVTLAGPRMGLTTIEWAGDVHGRLRLPMAMFDHTLPYFCGGVTYYAIHKRWGTSGRAASVAAGVFALAIALRVHDIVLAFAGPVMLVYLGARRSPLSRLTERTGDISYGVYLFGWPSSLLVANRLGVTSPVATCLLSVPLVFGLALAMHVLVEVPVAERLKPWVFRWLPRFRVGPRSMPAPTRRLAIARAIAYAFCLVTMVRFVIYPYPYGANWFGYQVLQLVAICVVVGGLIKAGAWPAPPAAGG